MLGSVYIKDKKVYLHFDKSNMISEGGYIYDVGVNLAEFLCYDYKDIQAIYSSLVNYLIDSSVDNNIYEEQVENDISSFVHKLDNYCVYLHFYTITLLRFYINYIKDPFIAFKELFKITENLEMERGFFSEESLKLYNGIKKEVLGDKSTFNNPFTFSGFCNGLRSACDLAIIIILMDIIYKRTIINNEIKLLQAEQDNLELKDPLLKLFILDFIRVQQGNKPYYTYQPFSVKYELDLIDPYKFKSLEEAKTYITDKEINLVELYQIESLDDLIRIEFKCVIEENMKVKQCKYCKQYFFPKGRVDTEYCDRIIKGEDKKCSEIGAIKLHQAQKANDPIYQSFQKAYRRMNSRVRHGKISKEEFYTWSEEARKKRDNCSKGFLDLTDFQTWLDQDKKN